MTEALTTTPVKLSPMLKTITPGLIELGKIKIGRKGKQTTSGGGKKFQPPTKLSYFLVTGLERDATGNFIKDEAIHKIIGDEPKRIPITLLFDDIALNFPSWMAHYQGETRTCKGDGEHAYKQGSTNPIECPCDKADVDHKPAADRCKMNGMLSCIIRGAGGVGGVWRLRTTSYNSITGITSALALIKRITGGPLSGIDLDLVIAPKTGTDPDGKSRKIYIVGVEYVGELEKLRNEGLALAQSTVTHKKQLAALEGAVLTAHDAEFEDVADVVEEFYPENAEGYAEPATIDLGDLEDEDETPKEKPAKKKPKNTNKNAQVKPPAQTEDVVGDTDSGGDVSGGGDVPPDLFG